MSSEGPYGRQGFQSPGYGGDQSYGQQSYGSYGGGASYGGNYNAPQTTSYGADVNYSNEYEVRVIVDWKNEGNGVAVVVVNTERTATGGWFHKTGNNATVVQCAFY